MMFLLFFSFIVGAVGYPDLDRFSVREDPISCFGRPDGQYVNGCNATYTHCVWGVTHEKSCADGLFFNPHKGRCDDRQKIDLCTEPGKYGDVTLAAMCTAQFNGCYSYGCSSHYYCCSYGIPTEKMCDDDKKFDTWKNTCNFAQLVNGCGIEGDYYEP